MHVIYQLSYNNMTYIGQTSDIKKRLAVHRTRSKTVDSKLYRATRKYGFDKFKFTPLVLCADKKTADLTEMLYITGFGNLNSKSL